MTANTVMSRYGWVGASSSSAGEGMDSGHGHPLDTGIAFVEALRTVSPEMPMNTALFFLLIAKAEEDGKPLSQIDLIEKTGYTMSTVSRNVSLLSEAKAFGVAGLGLIESTIDPRDRRYRVLTLTADGRKLAGRLKKLFT